MRPLFKFTLALIPFLVIAGVIVYNNLFVPSPKNNIVSAEIVPDGWYLHELATTSVIMTPSRFLRKIHDTELYAYGEQIIVEVRTYDGPPNPKEWEYLDWTTDDENYPGTRDRQWIKLSGNDTYRYLGESGPASGGDLTYYIFAGDTVHTLSLYPAFESTHLDTFEAFAQAYAAKISK